MAELKPKDQKLLWGVHAECAFPDCHRDLIEVQRDAVTGEEFRTVLGEGAHIRSATPNGPRYEADYPSEKLETYENRILLCGVHHRLIDSSDGRAYTVEMLEDMKAKHERRQIRLEKIDGALRPYLVDQFGADDKVLFRQVRLDGPSVDSMFVDVPFSCRSTEPAAAFLGRIAREHSGDSIAQDGFVTTGAAQALLHPDWSGNALLVGGPGQGKSTLLQFLCQFHRGRCLDRQEYSGEAQALRPLTETVRVPIRLDLREYAAWARESTTVTGKKPGRKQNKADRGREKDRRDWPSLEQFVASQISRRSGGFPFGVGELATLVSSAPVLLALDGLDEVANLRDRDRVAAEVLSAASRLSEGARDLVVLVATRPGFSESELWRSAAFPTFYLQRLTAGLRLQYLQRWCRALSLTPDAAARLQQTFLQHEDAPHIRDLASYPMQLAILLYLLYRRGLLPQQRTQLYEQYLETFLDREEGEGKEPLLSGHRQLILDVHAYLGWHLQVTAEQGDSSGRLARDQLRQMLARHLEDRAKGHQLATEIFDSINSRVLCLVERESGFLEFEVQSLREYFAAEYLHQHSGGRRTRPERVEAFDTLLARPYWLNVCRFFVGKFTQMEIRGIRDSLDDLQVKPSLAAHPHLRTAALRLLDDRALQEQRDATVRSLVDFILDGPGAVLAEDGFLDDSGQPPIFGEGAGRAEAVDHLQQRLLHDHRVPVQRAAASALLRHIDPAEAARWWWGQFTASLEWLEVAGDLDLLKEVPMTDVPRLARAVASGDNPLRWTTELLVDGGYGGDDADVLRVCLAEVRDGSGEVITVAPTPLGQVVAAARVAALRFDRSSQVAVAADGAAEPWPLPELEATSQLMNRPHEDEEASWAERISRVFDIWGASWVTAQAIAVIPPRVVLRQVASLTDGDDLVAMLMRESDSRENAADGGWWQNSWNSSESELDRRRWLYGVLTTARPRAVRQLVGQINQGAEELLPRQFRSLESALTASRHASTSRELNLREELRRGHVEFSARSLLLLRQVATPATIEQIDKELTPLISDVLMPGMGDRRGIVQMAGNAKSLKVDNLENSRAALSHGDWTEHTKIGAITDGQSRRILADPGRWPDEIVARAIQRQARLLTRQSPVADVAAAAGWFQS